MDKYRYNVYDDVIEYYKENFGEDITREDVDKMARDDVLKYWLEWNGIIGYTYDIVNIIEANEDLYSKKDLINSLNAYVDVLKHDENSAHSEEVKQVLRNVAYSISEIIDNLKD